MGILVTGGSGPLDRVNVHLYTNHQVILADKKVTASADHEAIQRVIKDLMLDAAIYAGAFPQLDRGRVEVVADRTFLIVGTAVGGLTRAYLDVNALMRQVALRITSLTARPIAAIVPTSGETHPSLHQSYGGGRSHPHVRARPGVSGSVLGGRRLHSH